MARGGGKGSGEGAGKGGALVRCSLGVAPATATAAATSRVYHCTDSARSPTARYDDDKSVIRITRDTEHP